jgi:hypothetical protein
MEDGHTASGRYATDETDVKGATKDEEGKG